MVAGVDDATPEAAGAGAGEGAGVAEVQAASAPARQIMAGMRTRTIVAGERRRDHDCVDDWSVLEERRLGQ